MPPMQEHGEQQVLAPEGEVCPCCCKDGLQELVILPLVHPAAAFHNPQVGPLVQSDFLALGALLRGLLEPPSDRMPDPDYRQLRTKEDVCRILASL